jgi:putative selenate reductase
LPDKFSILKIDELLKWILEEEKSGSIFGIARDLFFEPSEKDVFKITKYRKVLDTPIGVAAGPHTQLAQNIISAYLTGSRYIELKTIQTLDNLQISKPCIDMEDEGYNCEWSQELKLKESFDQYLDAFIIIHILNHKFGWGEDINCIFNMSAGYNLEGILKDNVQEFLLKMSDAKKEMDEKLNLIEKIYPQIKNIRIPDKISDNITLSTMHGCPPGEIEKIAKYFIEKKKLHTTIKLNPTLLGYEDLNELLNTKLGFETVVPESAFEHDLKYEDAVSLISSVQESARKNDLEFSLKLTNTLECINNKSVFPEKEKMMYMSGRALHPISIALARKLQNDFNGELVLSFSAGADCFNIPDLLACGIKPITVCTDLLKPGGYARQNQYLKQIEKEFEETNAKNIDEFIIKRNPVKTDNIELAISNNLNIYSEKVKNDPYYRKSFFQGNNIKTDRDLTTFDCIKAPCIYTCPDSQDIPGYLYFTYKGDLEKAFQVVLKSNPFPSVTGMICDHMCQTKCTRMNYDNPILIREVKRFISENAKERKLIIKEKNGKKVTIIGAGPSGLSASYFLALEGFEVEVYDSKGFGGGMVSDVIPEFRLSREAIKKDVKRIENLGVRFIYNRKINDETLKNIIDNLDNNFLYIAIGAQKSKKLNIKGEDNNNVLDALKFLSDIRKKIKTDLGNEIAIIGGGNTAIDTARTAKRIAGDKGNISLIYRRTRKEMPADKEEVKSMIAEGIKLIELTHPKEIIAINNRLKLICFRMKLAEKDETGRARPEIINGSEFEMEFDTIIPAIGQESASEFLKLLTVNESTYETKHRNVFLGGDALRGSSTLIKAIADGKNVAQNIINRFDTAKAEPNFLIDNKFSINDFQKKNVTRIFGESVLENTIDYKSCFDILTQTFTPESARKEASRCLFCDTYCNVCVTVCPNRANISFITEPIEYNLEKIIINHNKYKIHYDRKFQIEQKYQVLNIRDFCNECGNCTTFCPTNGAPFINKPHLFLNKNDFASNQDEGYFISIENGKRCIEYKSNCELEKLILDKNHYSFQKNNIDVKLDKKHFNIIELKLKNNFTGEIKLEKAADMSVLLKFLPEYLFFN